MALIYFRTSFLLVIFTSHTFLQTSLASLKGAPKFPRAAVRGSGGQLRGMHLSGRGLRGNPQAPADSISFGTLVDAVSATAEGTGETLPSIAEASKRSSSSVGMRMEPVSRRRLPAKVSDHSSKASDALATPPVSPRERGEGLPGVAGATSFRDAGPMWAGVPTVTFKRSGPSIAGGSGAGGSVETGRSVVRAARATVADSASASSKKGKSRLSHLQSAVAPSGASRAPKGGSARLPAGQVLRPVAIPKDSELMTLVFTSAGKKNIFESRIFKDWITFFREERNHTGSAIWQQFKTGTGVTLETVDRAYTPEQLKTAVLWRMDHAR